jgi:cell wall-associated NlpC family hydrolase
MIEQRRSSLLFSERHDSDFLQRRASRQRQRHKQTTQSLRTVQRWLSLALSSPTLALKRLPTRYLLHAVIALVMPLAVLLGSLPLRPTALPAEELPLVNVADLPLGLGPVNLDAEVANEGDMPLVGDAPLAEEDALPVPLSLTSRSEALAPLVVPAMIAGDVVKLRNGPSLEYDDITKLTGGTPIEVIGRRGDWFQVREAEGKPTYWVAGELIDIPEAAIYTLFEVQEKDIPPPPPPKVATVREAGLNLRDGPGKNYVGMLTLEAGAQLALLEQYQDWLHVVTSDNLDGWVSTQFLSIGEGIMHRVHVAEAIPDPNPALVGLVNDSGVNLRKGPGSAYTKIGSTGTGTEVALLARHKDWFKVQTANGTKAWIFGELLNVAPMARRRVPYTNDIPALPKPKRGAAGGGASVDGSRARLIPASGDVASYAVQFVGYRYRWGGSGPGGFDCSGLTSYVYRQYGVRLPHSAAGQYSTAYGAMVGQMGNLAPGDLMFFVSTGGRRGISHVALYIGGGRMVHAMTPGLGVQVSSIWSGYWTSHYYGAIRPYR